MIGTQFAHMITIIKLFKASFQSSVGVIIKTDSKKKDKEVT